MMKYFKIVLLLLIPAITMAQDSITNITPRVFNENGQYFIVKAGGWLFKQGNDTAWARKDIDTKSWKKMSPEKLSAKNADKNGRAEGWFRLKIKIADTLADGRLGIKSNWWAAEDIFVDGQLITSYGNTGLNGKPFHESSITAHMAIPIPINFKPGTIHTVAVHFVDYLAPVPPLKLKSRDVSSLGMVSITNGGYNFNYLKNVQHHTMANSVWVSVCIVLCLLFWLLHIQNPLEKNLRTIAIGSTFLALNILMPVLLNIIGLPYLYWLIFGIAASILIYLTLASILFILVSVFGRRINKALKIFMVIYFIGVVISIFLPDDISNSVAIVTIAVAAGLNIYYIVSSWKSLKGPQWSIVAGLMISLIFGFIYFVVAIFMSESDNAFLICITGYSLSFPLSLLVYVSLRFKQIITEVRAKAAQVVQLSEEKEKDALNRQKVLEQEVNKQTAELRTTLDNLKSAQAQLVQSEKMASLGELTAGIAHEIQNPLNFVNNFSDVNREMLEELKAESEKPKAERDEQLEAELIGSLIENEGKINHHGKRADAIVKGMLQHSKSGSGTKQLTDINALADECMRLAYHGLRAKDNAFNSELVAKLDETLPKVNVIPQDIGRVLLNLFNNAFYAVNEKAGAAGTNYKPTVAVSTYLAGGFVLITVRDNGAGIPQKILDKIYQPFFTTKPSGQGTGLGLSLSYDIVKANGGDIKVESQEGIFTEFIVQLPLI